MEKKMRAENQMHGLRGKKKEGRFIQGTCEKKTARVIRETGGVG